MFHNGDATQPDYQRPTSHAHSGHGYNVHMGQGYY